MADQNDPPTAIRSTTTVIGGRPHANGHFQPYFRRVRGVRKRWRFPLPWRSLQQWCQMRRRPVVGTSSGGGAREEAGG
ncbi:hypothetical protein ERO13_A07G097401v2 [Gossypium hirsutum]|nr:hypothetical protein ERO13_A07G097401v2 [Gossypium hirsutum]